MSVLFFWNVRLSMQLVLHNYFISVVTSQLKNNLWTLPGPKISCYRHVNAENKKRKYFLFSCQNESESILFQQNENKIANIKEISKYFFFCVYKIKIL